MPAILSEPELAELYSEATVGVSLSLTNYSRVSQEMMACGLPCVELDTPSVRAALGASDAVTLAPFDPLGLADAVERPARRPRPAASAKAKPHRLLVADRTWERAAGQFEQSLREAVPEDSQGLRRAVASDLAKQRMPRSAHGFPYSHADVFRALHRSERR